ncbi:MAG: hypothetical protein U0800_07075 [Isosphaeraceae bacterium]
MAKAEVGGKNRTVHNPQGVNCMELGPYAADVRDIVDLVESGAIFRNPRPPVGTIRIIHDMGEVSDYDYVLNDNPEEGWSWKELIAHGGEVDCDRLLLEMPRRQRALPGLMESLSALSDGPIDQALDCQLGGQYMEKDISYIWANIDWILRWRATFGRTVPFIERLVEIYRLGGHPCGWVGEYPEGQMVCYFPPGDDDI